MPDVISAAAIEAAQNILDVCIQHAAFLAGRGDIEEMIQEIIKGFTAIQYPTLQPTNHYICCTQAVQLSPIHRGSPSFSTCVGMQSVPRFYQGYEMRLKLFKKIINRHVDNNKYTHSCICHLATACFQSKDNMHIYRGLM